MYPAVQGMPSPIGTLDDLLTSGGTSAIPLHTFITHNLGNRTFLMHIPMHEFYRISEVANDRARDGDTVAQRKLDLSHAQKLAVYILKGLVHAAIQSRVIKGLPSLKALESIQAHLGSQPYLSMQPIVANIRTCEMGGSNIPGTRMLTKEDETACFKVFLSQEHVLWVVDGQHRRKAMQLLFEFLETIRVSHAYPKKTSLYNNPGSKELTQEEIQAWQECFEVARSYCKVSVEVHLGLGVDEERQLFHDLNNLAKKVESSLALQFDNSNPINRYIKEVLIDDVLEWDVVEKDISDWDSDSGAFARKDLVAVNAILFLNKSNISGATPPLVEPKIDKANAFWTAIKSIPGLGEERAKLKTVAAQPVVLKALAKLWFDFAFSKRKDDDAEKNLDTLASGISKIDFSHNNPMWRIYVLPEEDVKEYGLESLRQYLPSDDEGKNRDVGAYDAKAKVMRFGAKHNDIYPIIGDMVRWKLGLPSRHEK